MPNEQGRVARLAFLEIRSKETKNPRVWRLDFVFRSQVTLRLTLAPVRSLWGNNAVKSCAAKNAMLFSLKTKIKKIRPPFEGRIFSLWSYPNRLNFLFFLCFSGLPFGSGTDILVLASPRRSFFLVLLSLYLVTVNPPMSLFLAAKGEAGFGASGL